jgi:hypothetical protein
MIFLASLARSARIETRLGTYSVHHVQPAFFNGFESVPDSGIKLALPEKALVDFLYLSPTRGRLFNALPELELPRGFRRNVARGGSSAFRRAAFARSWRVDSMRSSRARPEGGPVLRAGASKGAVDHVFRM